MNYELEDHRSIPGSSKDFPLCHYAYNSYAANLVSYQLHIRVKW
jgi:hypothetical protein